MNTLARAGDGDWLSLLVNCLQQHMAVVRAVITHVRGSAPREAGASMIVTADALHGTIGGGRLEWEVLRIARALLCSDSPAAMLRKFVLGPELGQCCGGVVEVWIERFTTADLEHLVQALQRSQLDTVELRTGLMNVDTGQRVLRRVAAGDPGSMPHARVQQSGDGAITLVEVLRRPPVIWLYGAGHVGRAVVRIAAELPWQVIWIDSRTDALAMQTSDNIEARCVAEPVETVRQAPRGCCFLVMTHSHALDYAVCRAILDRGDYSWAGLIGSNSKSARFRAQLRRDRLPAAEVKRLVCPIGVPGIHGKHPAAIAVSVLAQLLQHLQPDSHAQIPSLHSSLHTEHCTRSCNSCDTNVVPS
jgi:xanthine dehydrogenase accessory factor